MTTSPFGTPNPFASPETTAAVTPVPASPGALPGRSKRTPLLIGLVGVAAAAAVGTGLFFFTQSGDDTSNESEIALPVDPGAPASTPTDTPAPLPTVTQYNGRNPFAAQVVEGGAGAAPASTPIPKVAVSTGSSALTGGGGTDGENGTDGTDGSNGRNGAPGAKGDKGDTPAYVQVTFRGGDGGNPLISTDDIADFTIVSTGQPVPVPATAIEDGELLGTEEPTTWVRFLKLNLDIGGEAVSALVQVGDATYVLPLDQPMVLFEAPVQP